MGKKTKPKIFFNYAAVGPIDKSAYRAALKFLKDYQQIGPPEALELYEPYAEKFSVEAAKLLNCDPGEIVYTKNTTEGLIIASEALPLVQGDEALLSAFEYPANIIAWLKKKKDGVNVKIIEGSDSRQVFLKILKSINKKTKAVSISWGQYYDGYIPDLALLSKVCQKNNTFLIVDGAHGVGARQIDLKKIHIDMLACGGQKALGALPGTGFLYVNKNITGKLLDFKVGIRSVKHFDNSGYELKDTAQRFYDGTQNLLGIVSLYAAIKNVNETGIKKIEKKNIKLLNSYKNILRKNSIPFVDYENQANIISLRVGDPVSLANFLRQRGVYIKAVKDAARISFSHTSNLRDFIIVVKYIKEWLWKTRKNKINNKINYIKLYGSNNAKYAP